MRDPSCCVEFAMVRHRYPSGRRVPRKNRGHHLLTAALVAISLSPAAFYANFQTHVAPPPVEATADAVAAPAPETTATASIGGGAWVLTDPKLTLQPEALALARNAPLAAGFAPRSAPRMAASVAPRPATPSETDQPPQPSPEPIVAQAVQPVPLPVPRPAEFRVAKAPPAPQSEPRKTAGAAPAPAPVRTMPRQAAATGTNPSFFEKLFGIKPATPPESALSYAALDTGSIAPGAGYDPAPAAGGGTAVYDIAAKVVIMPNGERLEAHSGLGDKLDDPRFVHVRMRGPTPPGTYILSEREALFHGVRALRLTPVGGSAAIYGRDGILAHTYMLGPKGDSNGCVSFRDYNRFLQAYLRGEVKRLVVVAGRGQDALPRVASTRS